ncbi:MAG: hypothetical protein ACLRZH_15465 [Ruthenibacterium lactatiformans]
MPARFSRAAGRGIGRELYPGGTVGPCARKKLYLSAHSAVETQAFYAAMGCGMEVQ